MLHADNTQIRCFVAKNETVLSHQSSRRIEVLSASTSNSVVRNDMKQIMLRHLLVAICFTLIFVDLLPVSSFVSTNHPNSNSFAGIQRCKTELMQQKKRAPVGVEFIELGSSLITLLNLAQEIGSSNNLRFRQAADKLRDQFARSFALRYDLEKSQFLSSALSSIDGDSQLTPGR